MPDRLEDLSGKVEVLMVISVAIVGKPNVGKSTLFNALVGNKSAIVNKIAGVTRDRQEGEANLCDLCFKVIDTAGFEETKNSLSRCAQDQTWNAVQLADVILFLVDAAEGITAADRLFADLLRSSCKPIILIANKAERKSSSIGIDESFSLGFGRPLAISAEHKKGLIDLYEALLPHADADREDEPCLDTQERPLKMCIVGRPNTGKSTLINCLLNETRLVTGPEAGITRDTISIEWCWRGRLVHLFDTAGLRKRPKVQDKLEQLSVSDALSAIQFADVVVVCVEATKPFEKQDLQIIDMVAQEGRGAVVSANKWDLVEDKQSVWKELREARKQLVPQMRGIAIVHTSGVTMEGLEELMQAVLKTNDLWNKRVSTAKLNLWLQSSLSRRPPPSVAGQQSRIKYITQIKRRPPHFVLFASRPDKIPSHYTRYLTNDLRRQLDMPGVPIRFSLRSSKNPYTQA